MDYEKEISYLMDKILELSINQEKLTQNVEKLAQHVKGLNERVTYVNSK